MTPGEPQPFSEALRFSGAKRALPTTLDSAGIRGLDRALVRRSVVSAKLTIADQLQLLGDLTERIAGGITEGGAVAGAHERGADRMISIAEAKAQLRENLLRIGYQAKAGEEGTIKDFASHARRELQVETIVLDTLGYGRHAAAQDETALDLYPAQELVRMVHSRAPRDWPERWNAARAATITDGATDAYEFDMMIALKNHPIWQALGDGAGGYEDTLGNPWPPFAFRSGMNVVDVSRERAVALGLLAEHTKIPPAELPDLNDGFEADTARFDKALRDQLAADHRLALDGDVLTIRNRAAALLHVLRNDGNSDGAKKGWATRRGGAPARRESEARTKRAVRETDAQIGSVMRQRGRFAGRVRIEGIGEVRLVHGRPGTWKRNEHGATHHDGYGLSHIHSKHGDAGLRALAETLHRGKADAQWRREVTQDGVFFKKEVVHGEDRAVVSRKEGRGQPVVVTEFNEHARNLTKTDRRARQDFARQKNSRLPERFWRTVNRLTRKTGTGLLVPCPTRAKVSDSSQGAGASKDSNFTASPGKVKNRARALLALLNAEVRTP